MSSNGPPFRSQLQPSSKIMLPSIVGRPTGIPLAGSALSSVTMSGGIGGMPPGTGTPIGTTIPTIPLTIQGGKVPKGPRRSTGCGTKKNSGGRGSGGNNAAGGASLGSGGKMSASTIAAAAAAAVSASAKNPMSSLATGAMSLTNSSSHGQSQQLNAIGGGTTAIGGNTSMLGGGLKDPSKDESKESKEHHSRSYPRGVGLDFRKLAGLTLLNYIDHHGVPVRPEAPPSELAVAVARHFEVMEIDEEECIGGFLERLEAGGIVGGVAGKTTSTEYSRTTGFFDGYQMPLSVRKRQRSKLAARPGEQVAAKITRSDENGSWILASVQRFYNDTETYDVQDEDDTSKLIRLPWNYVMRLSTGGEGVFSRGSQCMAIFPETTSFYRAKISKEPVWKLDTSNSTSNNSSSSNKQSSGSSSSMVPIVKEMIVKFEDDEDDTTGKTPHRRVPARYVIPLPHIYFYDELDDVDLSLAVPNSSINIMSNTIGANTPQPIGYETNTNNNTDGKNNINPSHVTRTPAMSISLTAFQGPMKPNESISGK